MGQKNQPLTSSKHHFRPQSRGGNNTPENYQEISDEKLHKPYHHLFANLRPHEIAILFMFSWGTQYVPLTERSYAPENIDKYEATLESWKTLFGERKSVKAAIGVIRKEFVRTDEDKDLMEKAFTLRSVAKGRDVPFIAKKRCAPANEKFVWDDQNYSRIFGRLDPHEAILLTFLSWDTVCPYREFLTSDTHKTEKGETGKPMKTRKKTWDYFFGGESNPWKAIKTIRSMVDRNNQPIESNLIKRAFAICRAMGSQ